MLLPLFFVAFWMIIAWALAKVNYFRDGLAIWLSAIMWLSVFLLALFDKTEGIGVAFYGGFVYIISVFLVAFGLIQVIKKKKVVEILLGAVMLIGMLGFVLIRFF